MSKSDMRKTSRLFGRFAGPWRAKHGLVDDIAGRVGISLRKTERVLADDRFEDPFDLARDELRFSSAVFGTADWVFDGNDGGEALANVFTM